MAEQRDNNPNEPQQFQLKPKMEIALTHILNGASQAAAASAAGVGRQTVNDWVNHHPEFRAAMTRHHNAAHEMLQTRLSNAGDAALTVLLNKLDEGDVNAAKAVLRLLMSNGNRTPAALPATAADVVTADADRLRQHHVQRDTEIELQSYDVRIESLTPELAENTVLTQIDQALVTAEHREHTQPNGNTAHNEEPNRSISTSPEQTAMEEDTETPTPAEPERGDLDAA